LRGKIPSGWGEVALLTIRTAGLTDVGVKRSHNQDSFAMQPAEDERAWRQYGHVFLVADGMGGHAVGEKASQKAVRDIPLTYVKHVQQEGPIAAIRRAFQEANEAIFQIGQNNPEFKGLGTTGSALILRPEGAWVGHVGDSRVYRIRGQHIQQLTFDHSWVWEVARRQGIDPDELGDFKRNVIIRSLGPDAEVEVDIEGPHPIEVDDRFLICSDGLTNEVTPEEIGIVLQHYPPEAAAKYLVELANIRGGRDNISCIVVQVHGGLPSPSRYSWKPWLQGMFRKVTSVVPWPFLALALGAIFAAISVMIQVEGLRTLAIPVFLGAALCILGGLVGLYLHLKRKSETTETTDIELPRVLNIHRDYQFTLGQEQVDRFSTLDAGLVQACKEHQIPVESVDWSRHDDLVARAAERAAREDWSAAFTARFEAVQILSEAYNRSRKKDEEFRPNWTKSQPG